MHATTATNPVATSLKLSFWCHRGSPASIINISNFSVMNLQLILRPNPFH